MRSREEGERQRGSGVIENLSVASLSLRRLLRDLANVKGREGETMGCEGKEAQKSEYNTTMLHGGRELYSNSKSDGARDNCVEHTRTRIICRVKPPLTETISPSRPVEMSTFKSGRMVLKDAYVLAPSPSGTLRISPTSMMQAIKIKAHSARNERWDWGSEEGAVRVLGKGKKRKRQGKG